jgi:type III secretion protein N (ATPase)
MSNVAAREQLKAASRFRQLQSRYADMELLIRLGEYQAGNDAEADAAVDRRPAQLDFLRQDTRASAGFDDTVERLQDLAA